VRVEPSTARIVPFFLLETPGSADGEGLI